MDIKPAIVRNVNNNDLYAYFGEDKYKNLRTGVEGIVQPEIAQKAFKINIEATYFYNECRYFKELISKLNLKIDKN